MADIPEYEKRVGIQPVQAMGGFTQALSNVAASTQGLADMSYQVAQNASLEQARLAGIEAAKNPGRKLLPSFTPSDAEFVKAYKNEVYNSLKYEGSKTIMDLYKTAATNPTNAAMADFEKSAQEVIQNQLGMVSEDSYAPLQRDLEGDYQTKLFSLSQAVAAKNKQYMIHSAMAQLQQASTNVYENSRLGFNEEAKINYEQSLSRISELEQMGTLQPDEALKQRNELWLKKEMGRLDKDTVEQIQNDTFEKGVQEFRENRPEGMSLEMHDKLVLHKMQFGNQYNAALKGQQNLDYVAAQIAYQKNDIEGAMAYRETMGAANKADFDLYVAKHSGEQTQLVQKGNVAYENLKNPIFLANQTPSIIDYAMNRAIEDSERVKGSPLDLKDQCELFMNDPKVPGIGLQKRLSAALNAGSAEERLNAAEGVELLKKRNPRLLKGDGISKSDLALAGLYTKYAADPKYAGPEGLDKIKDSLIKVNADVMAERRRSLQDYREQLSINNQHYLTNETYRALGLDPEKLRKKNKLPPLPPGLTSVYYDLLAENIMSNPDLNEGVKAAQYQLRERYQHSTIDDASGDGKVMERAPTYEYTDLGYVMQNAKVAGIKQMIAKNEETSKKIGFPMQTMSWSDAPDTSDLLKGPLHEGPVYIEVNGQKSQITVESDPITSMSPTDEVSWSFCYKDSNGFPIPIFDPFSPFGFYRFSPNKELFSEAKSNPEVIERIAQNEIAINNKRQLSEYEQDQLDKAHKKRQDKFKNYAMLPQGKYKVPF